jgi:hypothetical protein
VTGNREATSVEFGPDHPEWCPVGKPEADEEHMHCSHWSDCEPCCRCGDDTPDPSCDCPRCTYVRQADQGYPRGELREKPDLEAPWPSGLCGKPRVCGACVSNMLCTFKVQTEVEKGTAKYGAAAHPSPSPMEGPPK